MTEHSNPPTRDQQDQLFRAVKPLDGFSLKHVTDEVSFATLISRLETNPQFRAEFSLEMTAEIIEGFAAMGQILEDFSDQMDNPDIVRYLHRVIDIYTAFVDSAYSLISEVYPRHQDRYSVLEEIVSQRQDLMNVLNGLSPQRQVLFEQGVQKILREKTGYEQYFLDELHKGAAADVIHLFFNDLMGFDKNLESLRNKLINPKGKTTSDELITSISNIKIESKLKLEELYQRLKEGYKWEEVGTQSVFENVKYWLSKAGNRNYRNFNLKLAKSDIDFNKKPTPTFMGSMGLMKVWVENVVSNAKKSYDTRVAEYLSQFDPKDRENVTLPPEIANFELSLYCSYVGYGKDRRLEFSVLDNGGGVTNKAATRELGAVVLTPNAQVDSTYGNKAADEKKTGTGTGMSRFQEGLNKLSNNTARLDVRTQPWHDGAISSISFAAPEVA